jgi:hypothetical protein
MDREVLIYQMTERFREAYGKGLDALERAPDGQWISASEFVFRDAFLALMQESYEAAVQAKIEANQPWESGAFSPSGPDERASCSVGPQG